MDQMFLGCQILGAEAFFALVGVPGGRQGPVGRPLGGPKFDPDQKTSLGTSRDPLQSF